MWLKTLGTQGSGYINSDRVLSIGLGKDANSRTIISATLPSAGGTIIAAPLAGPFLDETRAQHVLDKLMRLLAAGRVWEWKPGVPD